MKKIQSIIAVALLLTCLTARAEQVSTLFFLENAPMRHTINPAFQPVSDAYINLLPLGFVSLTAGNNKLTLSDLVYTDPNTGKTILALNPDGGDRQRLINTLGNSMITNFDIDLSIVNFGFRYKENGYIFIGVNEHLDGVVRTTNAFHRYLLYNTQTDPTADVCYDLEGVKSAVTAYTEFVGGYSHRLNDKWTIGGKVKFLLGQVYVDTDFGDCDITGNVNAIDLSGQGALVMAGPVQYNLLPDQLDYDYFKNHPIEDWFKGLKTVDYLTPRGYGGAIDFGFAYKPHPQVQISAAIKDLGFMVWKGKTYQLDVDTLTYYGLENLDYSNYVENHRFLGDSLWRDVLTGLKNFGRSIHATADGTTFTRMTNMRLNVGIDANFVNNMLGIGVFSSTLLYHNSLYTELTIGGAVRPCNWFNFALSYSLMENGKYSNFGAGLSLMPYDGINLTLAMDYIPTHYATYTTKEGAKYEIPYQSNGINCVLGFSFVWGTNKKKDTDKDGVYDKIDMQPNTPRGVAVDALGCALDQDGDGVPDYQDSCPNTRPEAYGFVDGRGCPYDSDNDSVPDWKDQCPNTPVEAIGYVDSVGCELDSDGDGVPDWKDQCPNTPLLAKGYVDSLGCEIDSDGDSVPDWRDKCPNTPKQAIGYVDLYGCELDTDKDGVPDWKDECPTVKGPAYNKGCPVIQKEVRTLLKKAMQGIQFETGKAIIKKTSYPLMDQIAKTFIDNPTYIIEVQGHTDNVGKEAQNKKLSQQRAESVMKYLVQAGVPADRMTAVGYGMEKPIADNKTKAGRATNRRVEFNITFEEVTYESIMEHLDTELYQEHLDSIQANDTIMQQINDSTVKQLNF